MKNENFVDFSWIINVITRRKLLILIPIAVSLFLSLVLLIFLPSKFKATTTLMVEPSDNYGTSEINVLMAGERLALTYSKIINSRPILEKVIAKHNLDISASELADMIQVQPIEKTQLIQLSVTHRSAEKAVALVNSLSHSFISHIKDLSTESYRQAIENNQLSVEQKQTEIDSIIDAINAQNKLKSDLETERTKLDLLLTLNQNNHQIQQQNIQALELFISESTNKIRLIEPAHIETATIQPPYVASILLFFSKDIATGRSDELLNISSLIEQIYSPILSRDYFLSELANKLGVSEDDLSSSRITYNALAPTQFFKISVSDNDPAQALLIADAIAEIYIDQIQKSLSYSYQKRLTSLQNQMDELADEMAGIHQDINENSIKSIPVDLELERLYNELSSKYSDLRTLQTNSDQLILESGRATNTIIVSETASQAQKQAKNKFIYAFVIMLLGVVAGLGLVFVFENFDDKVRTQEDVSSLLDQKAIGTISRISRGNDKLIFLTDKSPHVSEDFRKLSAVIRPALKGLSLRILLVTSPNSCEGKSTVAANLASVFARTGTSVILVDADLHHPRQHMIFNLPMQEGLSDCLSSDQHEPHLKETKIPNLRLLTCGSQVDNPSELLSTPFLEEILMNLSENAGLVIIDSPPILTLADASFITPYADGALLVLRSGVTKKKTALESTTILKNAGIKFVRHILNDVAETTNSYYQYYEPKAINSEE